VSGLSLNAAAGLSFANSLPGCSSQRVCILRCLSGLEEAIDKEKSAALNTAAGGGGVRAGKMEEVGYFGGGDVGPTAAGGRIGGGMPGGGPDFNEDGLGADKCGDLRESTSDGSDLKPGGLATFFSSVTKDCGRACNPSGGRGIDGGTTPGF
jgi:hypothetical protein